MFRNQLKPFYKKYGAFNIYLLAFLLSVTSCLSLGILTLFSIFADPLQKILNYSQSTINTTIIFQVLGLNLFTPLSGYIADAKGIWILSIISLFGYFISFNLIILIIRNNLNHKFIYLSFFLMGCSHISFLFSCLLNSAKSLGRYYRTLSISTPNMMVAFSAYIQIQILATYFIPIDDSLNSIKENFINILYFFLLILMISCLFSFFGCKLTDWTEYYEFDYEESQTTVFEDFLSFETSPLLRGAATVLRSPQTSIIGSPRSWYVDEESSIINLEDELSMLSSSTHLNSNSNLNLNSNLSPYKQKVNSFLFDPLMYPLMFSCLISIGSTEFFIANLNAILNNLNLSKKLDENLQLLSISSTVTRCIIMLFTDWFCTKFKISRITIFTICVIICGISHIYLSSIPINSINFSIVIIINSILNSSVFTLFPAILASIYGIEILGTTWGICSSSSIFGNMFLNLMYSMDFSSNCVTNLSKDLVICSTLTFFTSGSILVFFGIIVFWLRKKYLNRANSFF
ncbi:putative monocarboxylate transporter mch1 [Pichia californica]|uniref:Probable transporter MCH1 n=1 Tax=Pichia californica TaxID=460514 RepID=A0A9P7BFY9_9ASCO|nr:putative monocarboxylate transporter mch1 [[Candida] californica]KAG0688625.1 putative monocarboxylate transporter mch1 [[Candida] californica]